MESHQTLSKSMDDVAPNTKRGGDVRTLLSPRTVGSTSGYMGVVTIAPGDWVAEHYHPYSEEYLYLAKGQCTARLDGESHALRAGEGLLIPIDVKHRLSNEGDEEAFLVFFSSPLAPKPELGHVDTEERYATSES
jgi:putative monooxygenase